MRLSASCSPRFDCYLFAVYFLPVARCDSLGFWMLRRGLVDVEDSDPVDAVELKVVAVAVESRKLACRFDLCLVGNWGI